MVEKVADCLEGQLRERSFEIAPIKEEAGL